MDSPSQAGKSARQTDIEAVISNQKDAVSYLKEKVMSLHKRIEGVLLPQENMDKDLTLRFEAKTSLGQAINENTKNIQSLTIELDNILKWLEL